MRFLVRYLVALLLVVSSLNLVYYVNDTSHLNLEKPRPPPDVMQIRRDRFERNAKLDDIFNSIGKFIN